MTPAEENAALRSQLAAVKAVNARLMVEKRQARAIWSRCYLLASGSEWIHPIVLTQALAQHKNDDTMTLGDQELL
ncbi:hypothetical protein [Rhodococcoides fascians]|uniref:hypothetical protein n=1 Tax=Rhodococcoides fascians TaxID=1828 RepID=UPI00050C10ED|nr:hypothetical protein [Rhodococcus fascians]